MADRSLFKLSQHRFQILALDVDGTLLDRNGILQTRTLDAVRRAARAGIRPVLCTGRRYRRALPIARQLGVEAPLVCNSGAIIKETQGHRTLWRADLPGTVLGKVFDVFRDRGEPAVSFTDRGLDGPDFLVSASPSGRPLFDDYLEQNQSHAEVDADWFVRPELSHYHICAIGTSSAMEEFEGAIIEQLARQVQTFVQRSPRYAGTMCEILRHDANKWTALLHLAELWEIDPDAICAVGDDRNDMPMLRGAGFGVAMGHASPDVMAAADHVTGSDEEEGLAMLIDRVLLA
jgi:Cof subfamily protein (haloacid dehalogenase superfamily)